MLIVQAPSKDMRRLVRRKLELEGVEARQLYVTNNLAIARTKLAQVCSAVFIMPTSRHTPNSRLRMEC